jgi:hypothetical protein
VLVSYLFGILDREIVHLDADPFDGRFGSFSQVRLALAFEVSQPLLEIVVRGSHSPP